MHCIHCCTQNAKFKEITNSKNLFCGFKCQMSHYGIGLKIELMDGIEEFEDELVENSKTLKNLIEDAGTEETIPLPQITRAVFLQIVAFLKDSTTLPEGEALFLLLEAANYLDIEKLYNECVRRVIPTMMKLPNAQNLFTSYPSLKQIILEAVVLYSVNFYSSVDGSEFAELTRLIRSFPDSEKKKVENFIQKRQYPAEEEEWKIAIELNAATIYIKDITDDLLLYDITKYALEQKDEKTFNLILDSHPNFKFTDNLPYYIIWYGGIRFISLVLKKRKLTIEFLNAVLSIPNYSIEIVQFVFDNMDIITEEDYATALDLSFGKAYNFTVILRKTKRFKDSIKLKILLKKEFYSHNLTHFRESFDIVIDYLRDVMENNSRVFQNFLTENADVLKKLILRLKTIQWININRRLETLERIEQMLDEKEEEEGSKRIKN